ncbi:MAG: metallophosphoesterase family protein [Clostridia bacterium]|nr:metallophosphoesterase family protein [Clostridia bacterium]
MGKSLGCLLLLLVIIIEGWLVIGVRINADPPVVREYVIESDKISSPVTLVMLSDLHGCEHPTLIGQISEIAPDLILLCGDMINHHHETGEDILVTAAVVKELCKIAPVYYSLGNHELERIGLHESNAVKRITNEGAILLERDYVDLEIRGNALRLGGLYTPNSAATAKPSADSVEGFLSDFCASNSFRILLEHRPASFTDAIYPAGYEPELVLSGHLHGGHVILPFLGPVYGANSGFFPKYALGAFELGSSTLIVSAGLSTDRHIIPRVNNPTEITKIVLE